MLAKFEICQSTMQIEGKSFNLQTKKRPWTQGGQSQPQATLPNPICRNFPPSLCVLKPPQSLRLSVTAVIGPVHDHANRASL